MQNVLLVGAWTDMSDFTPIKLGFDVNAYMKEFFTCLEIALNRLSREAQQLLVREIQINGNGSKEMRDIACKNVAELSRTISDSEVELSIGIDESKLGTFSDRNFVATMVVLHGNVTHSPLMTKPGQMTWTKNVRRYRLSPSTNKDGSPRKPSMMPDSFMQFEKVNGFGASRHMLDNVFGKQIEHVLSQFDQSLSDLMDSIDYSQFITGG